MERATGEGNESWVGFAPGVWWWVLGGGRGGGRGCLRKCARVFAIRHQPLLRVEIKIS
jgi:hypothetical protein